MALAIARPFVQGLSHWTDSVAGVVVSSLGKVLRPKVVHFTELDDNEFSVHAGRSPSVEEGRVRISEGRLVGSLSADLTKLIKGSRIEVALRPSRFLFQSLQLPERATEYFEGIVRSQIERLTPWSAADAVFGWHKAVSTKDRMTLMVAATARSTLSPLVQAVAELRPTSIALFTTFDGATTTETGRIKVFDQDTRGVFDARRVSRALLTLLVICGAAALVSVTADAVATHYLQQEQAELSKQILARRAAISGTTVARSDSANLERRKHATAATVIVLDSLSRVLPDHTYLTELRIEGNKAQIIGISKDAPGLIKLIEQSPHFSRATFFAPTTRSPNDPGERFHIEVRVEPIHSPRS